MKNIKNTYLLKKQTKKDKEIAKYRRRSRAFLTFFIIAAVVALVQIGQNMLQSPNSNSNSVIIKSYINQTLLNNTNNSSSVANCQEPSLTSSIVNGIMLFMNKIFEYPGGFWTKFFIFLGVIYLIQVFFSLIFDVIELILLAFVVIKRFTVWVYKKITGKDKHEEQLKKIAEL